MTYDAIKKQAKIMGRYLRLEGFDVSHQHCLEVLAKIYGFTEWKILYNVFKNQEKRLDD